MAEGIGQCVHYSGLDLIRSTIVGFRLDVQAAKEAVEEFIRNVNPGSPPERLRWSELEPHRWHDSAAREIAKGQPDALKGYRCQTQAGFEYWVQPHVVPPLP
jgi:hypothetical protein